MTLNTMASPSEGSASVSWLTTPDLLRLGFCLTLNFSDCPRTVNRVKLTESLEEHVDPKFNLSVLACRGILNRANRRGKDLPKELNAALTEQSRFRSEPVSPGGATCR